LIAKRRRGGKGVRRKRGSSELGAGPGGMKEKQQGVEIAYGWVREKRKSKTRRLHRQGR